VADEINRAFFQRKGRKRWKGLSKLEVGELMSRASKTYWKSLSAEQRSAEMKRRAKVRKARRAKRAKSKS